MLEYRIARPEEEADILDLINLVFSQTKVPHHFDQLIPKVYAYPGYAPFHYVAVEDGKIRSCVAVAPATLHLDRELSLKVGLVGSVAMHEKSRGAGHMKKLMDMAIEDARTKGFDLLALGGQRQRYGYWDFEPGGVCRTFKLSLSNVRHAMKNQDAQSISIREITDENDPVLDQLHAMMEQADMTCTRDRERLLSIMQCWHQRLYLIENEQGVLGYLYGSAGNVHEMMLQDWAQLPRVLKAWMQGKEECTFYAPQHQPELSSYLRAVAEAAGLSDAKKYRILNWEKVLSCCLTYKQKKSPLSSGRIVVEIEGAGRIALSLQGGQALAEKTHDAPDFTLTSCQAVALFFSPLTLVEELPPLLKAWLPLPLYITRADTF